MPIWSPPFIVAFVILVSLIIYLLTGGADFGAGIIDFFCSKKNKTKEQEIINNAIEPIWETNHIWLILIVVLNFIAFPSVFSTMCIALHIPLTIMLIGIVIRGSSFIFSSAEAQNLKMHKIWRKLFSLGSFITPFMLGICIGAISSSESKIYLLNGSFYQNFISSWLKVFPLLVGCLTLCICILLASTYLVSSSECQDAKNYFRRWTIISFALLILVSALIALSAKVHAKHIYEQLLNGPLTYKIIPIVICIVLTTSLALKFKKDLLLKLANWLLVISIISGWAYAQFPYLIFNTHSIVNSAAPSTTLVPLLYILGAGVVFLVPSYAYLLFVFSKNTKFQS
ncbi:MAG: cytochrome d ubiquinol oxidase subunit II [bacterium]|nr:cytochrome d ubiquinol oxidase subunit II [bacterium]